MYDDVYLVNPRAVRQKVAVSKISGIGGRDKFYFMLILKAWFKVDVREVSQPKVPLMFPKEEADQHILHDVQGGNVIWDSKYIRHNP
jgi:hypothetical protein